METRFNVLFEINSCDYDVLLLSQTWRGSKNGMATGRNRMYLSGGFVHQGVGVVISNTFPSQLHDISFYSDSCTKNYCALWAYVSCHVYLCAKTQKGSQKLQAQQRSLFDSGEMALISLSHSRASRLWVWLYTSVKLGGTLVYRY